MSDDPLKLAERCEAATGAGRDTDLEWEIHFACQIERPEPLGYTASLDAAMTLAESFGGQVTFFKDGTAKAFLWQPYPLAVEAKAATPALALCAAALRARSAA